MKTVQLVWIAGLVSAPIAGWYTAKLKDADHGTAVTVTKPVAPAVAPVDAPPQPSVAPDELTRTKADLAKVLAAVQAPDANSAIENYTLLKSQIDELTAARDVATAALYKAGAANFEDAAARIAELDRQLAEERRAAEKSRRSVASLEALRDAQGWHSPSCPTCPPANTTSSAAYGKATPDNQAPPVAPAASMPAQPATIAPDTAPAQSEWVIVCYE